MNYLYEILICLTIAALFNKKLFAVGLFDGTVNSNIFEAIKQCLLPQYPLNSVIIMDNATFHKRETTRILIEQAGDEILWLPPYSPDLNPIEKKWAEIKNKRKKYQIDCIDTLFKMYGIWLSLAIFLINIGKKILIEK